MKAIGSLGLILLSTMIGGQVSVKCKLPAVIGELLAGIVIGPALLNFVQPNSLIKSFADLGVILLMFLAGLESDLEILKKLWRPSILVATLGVIIPILIAYWIGGLFQFSKMSSLFLGVTFAATSVSISVAVLQEMNCLETKEGMTILGAAVVDDILAVFLLSILTNIIKTTKASSSTQSTLIWSLILQVGFLVILVSVGFILFPWLIKTSRNISLPSADIVLCITIVLAVSVSAEQIGLSSAIGAFFVGLSLSQSSFKDRLQTSFTDLGYSTFIPVFFASIGLEMSLTGIFRNLAFFFVLLISSILSKLLGAGIGAKIAGFSFISSFQVASGMISRGEMALVIAQIGLSNHLLTSSAYSTVVGVIVLTTVIAPLFLKFTLGYSNNKISS